jgi:hypothetical protein
MVDSPPTNTRAPGGVDAIVIETDRAAGVAGCDPPAASDDVVAGACGATAAGGDGIAGACGACGAAGGGAGGVD